MTSPLPEPPTVLVCEDDAATRTFLADNLCADGFALLVAGALRPGLHQLRTRLPDLVVCDVGLPDGSGLALVDEVRSGDPRVSRVDPALPILLLSGRAGELDRVRALERGADDFLAKPFSYPELRARVAALLRRAGRRERAGALRLGPLEVDPASRAVLVRGSAVTLSAKEFALLRVLASDPSRVWTKAELLKEVWGWPDVLATRTLDSHACRLRAKLGIHGDRFVINVWGVGYRLCDPVATTGDVAEAVAA
jgi:DNA-binding response OmpR family regulator